MRFGLNPRAAGAFNNRGNALQVEGDLERALADYDEAIRLEPKYLQAYSNRGTVFLELGDDERAVADFDRAIAGDAMYASALHNRGLAHSRQRRFDLAIADHGEAIRIAPDTPRPITGVAMRALRGANSIARARISIARSPSIPTRPRPS